MRRQRRRPTGRRLPPGQRAFSAYVPWRLALVRRGCHLCENCCSAMGCLRQDRSLRPHPRQRQGREPWPRHADAPGFGPRSARRSRCGRLRPRHGALAAPRARRAGPQAAGWRRGMPWPWLAPVLRLAHMPGPKPAPSPGPMSGLMSGRVPGQTFARASVGPRAAIAAAWPD